MKDGQLLRVKIVKDKNDLPKEDGLYPCHAKEKGLCWFGIPQNHDGEWLFKVDWYIQPIELKEIMSTDEMIEKWAKDVNRRNFSYSFYDGLIKGAKWMRDKLKTK